MKLYASVLILNVLSLVSNADICLSGESNMNAMFLGTYTEQSGYYTHSICTDGTLYEVNDQWAASDDHGSSRANLRCLEQNKASPVDCNVWSNAGVLDSSIKATDGACAQPSLSCSRIQISGFGNSLDSTYIKSAENLYESGNYKFQFHVQSGKYIIATTDVRNECSITSAYLISSDRDIDNLESGGSVEATLEYPSGTATIACDPATPAPITPAPGSICVSGSSTAKVWGAVTVNVGDILGPYEPIGELDGYPAWQLHESCGAATLMWVDYYKRYMLVTDAEDARSTYFGFCERDETDIDSCDWGSQYYDVSSDFTSCSC